MHKGLSLIACVVVLSATGCAREGDAAVPEGCRAGPDAVRRALAEAPAEVRVDGTVMSQCVSDTSNGGELSQVGSSYVSVAVHLADAAVADPEGTKALQLGYLVGAVERSGAGSQGVGYELRRRLESEAARVPGRSRALRRGRRAGAARG